MDIDHCSGNGESETVAAGLGISGFIGSVETVEQVWQLFAVDGFGGVVDGKEVKMEVSVGDKVLTSKYAGTEVKVDGEEYTILRQSDILAIVD